LSTLTLYDDSVKLVLIYVPYTDIGNGCVMLNVGNYNYIDMNCDSLDNWYYGVIILIDIVKLFSDNLEYYGYSDKYNNLIIDCWLFYDKIVLYDIIMLLIFIYFIYL
jgi:hypothetical protein